MRQDSSPHEHDLMAQSPMKFFTPRLHRRMQSDRFCKSEWDSACESYFGHLRGIDAALPSSVRRLAKLHFHDCRIQRIEMIAPETLVLDLVGHKHFFSGRPAIDGLHRLTFRRVEQTNLGLKHLSGWVTWEEVDWTGDAAEWRVLLDGSTQLQVRFRSVSIATARPTEL